MTWLEGERSLCRKMCAPPFWQKMISRETSEKKRYKEIYNIEIDDLSIYDIVIESSKWDANGVFNIIENRITSYNVCYTKLLRERFTTI